MAGNGEDYVLTEYLGAGALGEVYRVETKEHVDLIGTATIY